MGIAQASAHFAGIWVASWVICCGYVMLSRWLDNRLSNRTIDEYAHQAKISREQLQNSKLDTGELQKFIVWLSDQYSYDYLENRLSDLLGSFWTIFFWVSHAVVACLVGATIFTMVEEHSLEPIVLWWFYIPFLAGLIVFHLIYAAVCKAITDRGPGQAKRALKDRERLYSELRSRICSQN